MPVLSLPSVSGESTLEELRGIVAKLIKEVQYLTEGGIDSKNMREIGGFLVNNTDFQARNKMVGMSSLGNAAESIRLWAGDADPAQAPFRVSQDGTMRSTRGFIGGWTIGKDKLSGTGILEGGTVRSGPSTADRIEMSGGKFGGYNLSGQKTGLNFDISAYTNTGIADIYLYHNDIPLARFHDEITSYRLQGMTGSPLLLGGNLSTTYAAGDWDFAGSAIVGTIPGNCQSATYAASSGTATAVPSTGVTAGTYTKLTVADDGRATAGSQLSAADIPSGIDPSKVNNVAVIVAGGKKVQSGSFSVSAGANTVTAGPPVTFSTPFTTGTNPTVLLTIQSLGSTNVETKSWIPNRPTASGFTANVMTGTAQNVTAGWIAIGD